MRHPSVLRLQLNTQIVRAKSHSPQVNVLLAAIVYGQH
eukprot:CAMPEP_0206283688 /NCGR_PEP_ID=MMETSP0047_2-20121206/40361_1 /ASSEMBLY_ACC=CAM_ASM_000192 /TAXON_ID=195065 /ORGANISM="Chroomonas mesostigmatica_cf, Strain CCMP1168" /LENGTH=37 /DNA_ID= /DNA_START= /DNA_END= /DNA_ORIENTATION=